MLDKLGFNVEVYYASEIDTSAKLVAEHRHRGRLRHVGDVCKLTADEVRSTSVCSACWSEVT